MNISSFSSRWRHRSTKPARRTRLSCWGPESSLEENDRRSVTKTSSVHGSKKKKKTPKKPESNLWNQTIKNIFFSHLHSSSCSRWTQPGTGPDPGSAPTLRSLSCFFPTRAWRCLRATGQRDRQVSRRTGEGANGLLDRQISTVVLHSRLLQALVMDHTGDLVSSSAATSSKDIRRSAVHDQNQDLVLVLELELDSPRCVLQVRVDLVVPITTRQHFSEGDAFSHFLSVNLPFHLDFFGVELEGAASEGGLLTSRGRPEAQNHVGLSWKQADNRVTWI